MTWTPITEAEMQMGRYVLAWIRTARESGGFMYSADWLPSDADMSKSALLERLRSGKEPLAEPPPLGMSCPWYALVEDAGPHYVFDVWRSDDPRYGKDPIFILQHAYEIIEHRGNRDYIVKDSRETSYRFRVWHDDEWRHPSGRIVGGWFMQNLALAPCPTPAMTRPDRGTP